MDPSIIYIIAPILIFIIQFTFCFKIKSLFIRLVPTIIPLIASVAFAILMPLSMGWDVLGYLLLAILAICSSFGAGAAWLIWWFSRLFQAKK